MKCFDSCNKALLRSFYKYGYFLGSHPFYFLLIPPVVCAALATGFIFYNPETDIELLYAPEDSRAITDRQLVVDTFPEMSGSNFNPFSQNRMMRSAVVIFRSVEKQDILSNSSLTELKSLYQQILALSLLQEDRNLTYEQLCARQSEGCVIDGGFVFSQFFQSHLVNNDVTFPVWTQIPTLDLGRYLSDVGLSQGHKLTSAGSLKLTFYLRQDNSSLEAQSKEWEQVFLEFMKHVNLTRVRVAYSVSESLNQELDKGTQGDIFYFSLTFTLMITFASVVSSGGDCVSTRALMANAGVLAVLFGIMGALGLVTYCGVRFVNMVGIMPFLTMGIGVDDMFLLMSSWSETLSMTDLTLPERMGIVYKKAGIGIAITSVTDFLAFAIGATSVFKSVRNFSIYTGVGVILCYICNATMFGAALTLHGRRVYARRHTLTCRKVTSSRQELTKDGRCCFYVCCCGGSIPDNPDEEQSPCEKGPRLALVRLLMWTPVRLIILVVFAGYLAVSIWGCTQLKQGLDMKDLVLRSSYYHTFQVWDSEDFGVKLPVSFISTSTKDYWTNETLQETENLLNTAGRDTLIDPRVRSCWLTSLAGTDRYNSSSPDAFMRGLAKFLQEQPRYLNDLVLSADNRSIRAARCHVYSNKMVDTNEQAALMTRMREVADSWPGDVFAYHPAFVYYEQYVEVLPSTLMDVGVTLAVMFVATCLFLPHPLMVVIVMVQVVMIVTGIMGFMALWGLTLSSVTMIHLIMSVGFSVDFCAHVCTAFMVSDEPSREGRTRDAIVHASSPILNGGLSSLIGVVVLFFTESYIFQTFFKIMVLVVGFGMLHAVFLVPVVLSFIGPNARVSLQDSSHVTQPRSADSPTPTSLPQNGSPSVPRQDGHGHVYQNQSYEEDAHLGYIVD